MIENILTALVFASLLVWFLRSQDRVAWLRYVYFLRFSLLIWWLPGILVALKFLAYALASGLLVPEFLPGYLCVAFFASSTGYAALVMARIVVINGEERFQEVPPRALTTLLVGRQGQERWQWIAPIVSQVFAVALFIYSLFAAEGNGVRRSIILLGGLMGFALASIFWYAINAWYYLAYQPRPAAAAPRRAQTLLFPRRLFGLTSNGGGAAANLEDAVVSQTISARILRGLAILFSHTPGYTEPGGTMLYEGHSFSISAALGFIGIYALLWPLVAPVPAIRWSVATLGLALVVVLMAVRAFWTAQSAKPLLGWKVGLSAAVLMFWISVVWIYLCTSAERFPILCVLLLVGTALCWLLSSLSFLLDRYRIPVFTTLLVAVALIRIAVVQSDEHYFSTTASTIDATKVSTPAQILDALPHDQPLIVVTATGGGLHASAWTAAVLAELEREFAASGTSLHGHLLLASTVSGGSEGLNTYLHAVYDKSVDSEAGRQHMQQVASCSGLEAVGWGLAFYDLPKAVTPLGLVTPVSSGVADLDTTPRFKDRTWALRKAFERNQSNLYCEDEWARDLDPSRTADLSKFFRFVLKRNLSDERQMAAKEASYTLGGLFPQASASSPDGPVRLPAFTMNTTSVEQGERFLLANYQVPFTLADKMNHTHPAQSYLTTFNESDLPLATAAQLSATFPYVNSTARAPVQVIPASVHFADGGYYDNDGTASAIEFVRSALDGQIAAGKPSGSGSCDALPKASEKSPAVSATGKAASAPAAADHCLHILWIEIRNSGDIDSNDPKPMPGGNGAGRAPWKIGGQLAAPLQTFWQAGHESSTLRNRNILTVFENAYAGHVSIQRVVFADSRPQTAGDPLNWSLTPAQRKEVRTSACSVYLQPDYRHAVDIFHSWKVGEPSYPPITPENNLRTFCAIPGTFFQGESKNPANLK